MYQETGSWWPKHAIIFRNLWHPKAREKKIKKKQEKIHNLEKNERTRSNLRIIPLLSHKCIPKMHKLFFIFGNIHKIIKHLKQSSLILVFKFLSIRYIKYIIDRQLVSLYAIIALISQKNFPKLKNKSYLFKEPFVF